jgi:hypothetical protein
MKGMAMADPITTEACETERRHVMAQHHLKAGMALLGFVLLLPATLMSSHFLVTLTGALGLFSCGMVAGYQAARMGQTASGRKTSN